MICKYLRKASCISIAIKCGIFYIWSLFCQSYTRIQAISNHSFQRAPRTLQVLESYTSNEVMMKLILDQTNSKGYRELCFWAGIPLNWTLSFLLQQTVAAQWEMGSKKSFEFWDFLDNLNISKNKNINLKVKISFKHL